MQKNRLLQRQVSVALSSKGLRGQLSELEAIVARKVAQIREVGHRQGGDRFRSVGVCESGANDVQFLLGQPLHRGAAQLPFECQLETACRQSAERLKICQRQAAIQMCVHVLAKLSDERGTGGAMDVRLGQKGFGLQHHGDVAVQHVLQTQLGEHIGIALMQVYECSDVLQYRAKRLSRYRQWGHARVP